LGLAVRKGKVKIRRRIDLKKEQDEPISQEKD